MTTKITELEKPGIIGFLVTVPKMVKNVWPGAWLLFVGVAAAVYFSDPGLKFMTLDEWLTSHILIVVGLLALTVGIYNALDRMPAAVVTIAVWLIAAGICYFAEAALRVAAGG
jgi:ABC-type xylose transport system permease subunit